MNRLRSIVVFLLIVGLSGIVLAHGDHEFSCNDSDEGNNIYFKGSLEDEPHNAEYEDICFLSKENMQTAIQGSILREYYCGNHNYQYEDIECENGCMEGKCMPESKNVGDCKDSDGLNLYSVGITQGTDSNEYLSREDYCSEGPKGIFLMEGYCDEKTSEPMFLQIECMKGCLKGVCLGSDDKAFLCDDSDEGKDTSKKGQIEGPLYTGMEEDFLQINVFKDECSEKEKGAVLEYYCSSGMIASETISCENGCYDGVCLEKDTDYNWTGDEEKSEQTEEAQKQPKEEKSCEDSCEIEGDCVPIGYRYKDSYCDRNNTLNEQKTEGKECSNDFECESNSCIDSQCLEEGFWTKIISWFKKLFS